MPVPFSPARGSGNPHTLAGSVDQEGFADVIGPMLAGAQARGVADAFELLGLGAALIDATGQVLHMGGRGRRVADGWLRVVENHLVAFRAADNRTLQTLIAAAIEGPSESAVQVRLAPAPDGETIAIKALAFPASTGAVQLLRAVLVFERVPATADVSSDVPTFCGAGRQND